MKRQYDELYPFLVVGTGVIVSPIVYFLIELFAANSRMSLDLKSAIQIAWLIGFGTLFSLPTLVISYFLFKAVISFNLNTIWKKCLCIVIAQLSLAVTLYFLTGNNVFLEFDPLLAIYALTIIMAGFYFKIKLAANEKAVL